MDEVRQPAEEHDVLVRLPLSNRAMGTAGERTELTALAEQLEDAVLAAGVGEFDGDEYGGGEYTLFFVGADADRLFAVLQPLLHRHRLGRNAVVLLQYGAGDPVTKRP